MSIRAVAQELYRCQAKVHKLEDQLQEDGMAAEEDIREQLRKARAELKILKNMIEGRKTQKPETKRGFYRKF